MRHPRLKQNLLIFLACIDLLIPIWAVNDALFRRTLTDMMTPPPFDYIEAGRNRVANVRFPFTIELGYVGVVLVWFGSVGATTAILESSLKKRRKRRKRAGLAGTSSRKAPYARAMDTKQPLATDYCQIGRAGCLMPAGKARPEKVILLPEERLYICASCSKPVCFNCSQVREFYLFGKVHICHECLRKTYNNQVFVSS